MAAGQTSAPGFGWINTAGGHLLKNLSQYIQDAQEMGLYFISQGHNGIHSLCRFALCQFDVLLEWGKQCSKESTMAKKIFVNLPVRDLKRSMDFFSELGFTFNAQFTDETAACMIISEDTL